jgi:hypothetical protein
MTLPQLPSDKANHFVYGFMIYEIVFFLLPIIDAALTQLDIRLYLRWLPLIATVIGAVGREVHDKIVKNKWEKWDAIATIAPALFIEINRVI